MSRPQFTALHMEEAKFKAREGVLTAMERIYGPELGKAVYEQVRPFVEMGMSHGMHALSLVIAEVVKENQS